MKKISDIQQKLKAPKGQYNAFGKYKYRSLEDILEAVKPLLGSATLIIEDEIIEIAGRVYVKATATLRDGEESVSATAYAREPEIKKGMDESQITGSSSSYARKYALNGLFLIDDSKDADSQDNSKSGDAIEKVSTIKTIADLEKHYKANKGLGKDFTDAVVKRKKELEGEEIPVVQQQ